MNTKELILSAAFKLFEAGNFESVSMSQLEKMTKLSKGAFYHHFKSKEEIFIQAMDLLFFNPELFELQDNDLEIEELIKYRCNETTRYRQMLKKRFKVNIANFSPYGLMVTATKHYPDFFEKLKLKQSAEVALWAVAIDKDKELGGIDKGIDSRVLAELFLNLIDGEGIRTLVSGNAAITQSESLSACLTMLSIARRKNEDLNNNQDTKKKQDVIKDEDDHRQLSLF